MMTLNGSAVQEKRGNGSAVQEKRGNGSAVQEKRGNGSAVQEKRGMAIHPPSKLIGLPFNNRAISA
jgi:hypothetical protein